MKKIRNAYKLVARREDFGKAKNRREVAMKRILERCCVKAWNELHWYRNVLQDFLAGQLQTAVSVLASRKSGRVLEQHTFGLDTLLCSTFSFFLVFGD